MNLNSILYSQESKRGVQDYCRMKYRAEGVLDNPFNKGSDQYNWFNEEVRKIELESEVSQ